MAPSSLLERDAAGYEQARHDAIWNGYKPERYPQAIVLAESADDVVEAVRYASAHDLRVKARSGGHSWTASSVREGALLIDLSRMDRIVEFDPQTAGEDLLRILARAGDAPDFSSLRARIKETQAEVRRVFRSVVEGKS